MQMKNFFNRTTNKHWQIEIDGQAIRTCLNGGKIKESGKRVVFPDLLNRAK